MGNIYLDSAQLAALSNQIGIVAEAQQYAARVVRDLKASGYFDAVEAIQAQLKAASQIDADQLKQVAQVADRVLTPELQRQMNAIAEEFQKIDILKQSLKPCPPVQLGPLPPRTNIVDHLSRHLDREQVENAALQHRVRQLEKLVRYYESRNPSDLPEHDVNGLFGSPS